MLEKVVHFYNEKLVEDIPVRDNPRYQKEQITHVY